MPTKSRRRFTAEQKSVLLRRHQAGGTLYSTAYVAPTEFVKGGMQREIKP